MPSRPAATWSWPTPPATSPPRPPPRWPAATTRCPRRRSPRAAAIRSPASSTASTCSLQAWSPSASGACPARSTPPPAAWLATAPSPASPDRSVEVVVGRASNRKKALQRQHRRLLVVARSRDWLKKETEPADDKLEDCYACSVWVYAPGDWQLTARRTDV